MMEIDEAKNILGLNDNFSQLELINSYKTLIDEHNLEATAAGEFSDSANKIYDISQAYLLLRDQEMKIVKDASSQPLIIFTDASVRENRDVAAFGVVAGNIPHDFNFPSSLIQKYNIIPMPNRQYCVFTGVLANYGINSAEIMAILCSVEIFMYLIHNTRQTMVIYTDSLVAKKVLSDKKMPPNTKLYSVLRKRFNQLKDAYGLNIIIKKVAAHAGIEQNELADTAAKIRLERSI